MISKKIGFALSLILIGTFVGGVFASTTPLGTSITSMFIANWPHTQNVTVTNWPKIPSGNTTVIVKTVYINTTQVINVTRFFIVGNHTIPFTGPITKTYGQVFALNQYCSGGFSVAGGNVTFVPYNLAFPTVSTIVSSSAFYQADLPSTQYLAHVIYSTPGGCGPPGDFYIPVTPSGNITRIDLRQQSV